MTSPCASHIDVVRRVMKPHDVSARSMTSSSPRRCPGVTFGNRKVSRPAWPASAVYGIPVSSASASRTTAISPPASTIASASASQSRSAAPRATFASPCVNTLARPRSAQSTCGGDIKNTAGSFARPVNQMLPSSLMPSSWYPMRMRIGIALSLSLAILSCATPQLGDKELPPRPPSLRAAFDQMPSPSKARLRVLSDNVDSWVSRWKTIEGADSRVDVQYFIIEPDAFGLSLLGLLYEKALDGKKVRLMVDSRGTPRLSRAFMGVDLLQEMARAGVDVR